MKRRAFTLMELFISVVLIALLSMYLYGSLGRTRASNKTLQTHTEAQEHRLKIYELLYRDLVESYTLSVQQTKNDRFHLLKLQTGNSLYDIAAPYVVYYVRTDTRQLIRLESADPITLPVPDGERERIHADLIEANVTDLNLYVQTEQNATAATASAGSASGGTASGENNASTPGGTRGFTNHLLYLATGQGNPLLMEIAF
jgi:prepilin-type N-terminal cleavage/methylation domain-containing protein